MEEVDNVAIRRRIASRYQQRLNELRMAAPVAYAQLCLRPFRPEDYSPDVMESLLVEIETILVEVVLND